MLKDKLEIILVTYNRKPYLEDTLNQLFCDESPIKDCNFTILDNCSTDGSSELIQEYSKKYNNIKHIRHNKNIGGNANITRAIEIATKKYFWVLCDDDKYDWTNWKEINTLTKREKEIAKLLLLGIKRKEVAQKLFLSESSVRNHITNILKKLQVENREDLCKKAKSFI